MRRRTPWIARAAAAVVGGVLVASGMFPDGFASSFSWSSFAASAFAASEDEGGVELLTRARDVAMNFDFTGEVVVEWRDDDGRLHRERVPVREADGVLRVGEKRKIIGAGDDRLLARDGVWKRLWAGPSDSTGSELVAVDPERKYAFTVSDGPRTAGRDTTLVEVALLDERSDGRSDGGSKRSEKPGRVSERFAVDDATGLLLRREQLDRRGRVERAVRFVELNDPTPASTSGSDDAPSAEGSAPKAIAKTNAAAEVPARLGHGFARTGLYRAADGSTHSFYSDGIYTVSVFRQDGELDRQELPDDSTSTDYAGRTLTTYSTPSGAVVVWADDDRVFTLVSDAPKYDLDAIVRGLPEASEVGTATEVARFVLGPFRW